MKMLTSRIFQCSISRYCGSCIKKCDFNIPIAVCTHYSDVVMRATAFHITGVSIVCSTVCSGADQRKHQSSTSLAFVVGSSPVTGEFPAQRASNNDTSSFSHIWDRHVNHSLGFQDVLILKIYLSFLILAEKSHTCDYHLVQGVRIVPKILNSFFVFQVKGPNSCAVIGSP